MQEDPFNWFEDKNINDTITIYADYIDDCEIQHSDSIKVVVE